MKAGASPEALVDDNEPIGLLRANEPDQAERIVPLFKRPARIVVGRDASCDWRFERFDGAPLELVWDGVRLKVDGRKVKADEVVVTDGGLEIVFELLLFSDEVTQIRRMPLPPGLREPEQTAEPEAPTKIEVQLPEPHSPQPWRCFVPPRNGAADDEPTVVWPVEDALRPTADLLDRLGRWSLRRLPRKKLALYAALAVVVMAEIAMLVRPHQPPQAASASAATFASEAPPPPPPRAMQPDKELEVGLKEGIRAYRAGRTADAIDRFGHIDQATGDPAARLMLFILRTRGAATP